jgi:AmpE protein
MSAALIAVVLVLLAGHAAQSLTALRRFDWLVTWRRYIEGLAEPEGLLAGKTGLAVIVAVPVVFAGLLQLGLRGQAWGLPGFVYGLLVLFYCWGPRDLERDAEAIDKAADSEQRLAAAQALRGEEVRQPLPFESAALVEATFVAALRRWFGVLFWFAVLGPAGALLYRLVQLLAFVPLHADALAPGQRELAARTARVLDWLPAHLMALSLALASNFDAVFKTWHAYHAARGEGYFSLDPGFLNAIARASVAADMAAEAEAAQATRNPLIALDDAMVLVRRVLVVWLTIIAVIVLAGWFA